MDFSASAATKDAARLRRRRFCTPPRFFSTLPHRRAVDAEGGCPPRRLPCGRSSCPDCLKNPSNRPHGLRLKACGFGAELAVTVASVTVTAKSGRIGSTTI